MHEWIPARARSIVWFANDGNSDLAEPHQIENCDSVESVSLQVMLDEHHSNSSLRGGDY